MDHLTLLIYAILLGSGFAGITMLIILYTRLKDRRIAAILGVMGLLTIWLFIHLIAYYWEHIVVIGGTAGAGMLRQVNQLLGLLIYIAVLVGLMVVESSNPRKRIQAVLSFLPLAGWVTLAGAAQAVPWIYRMIQQIRPFTMIISVGCTSVFLIYTGLRFYAVSDDAEHQRKTIDQLLHWIGIITLAYVPVALIIVLLSTIGGSDFDPTPLLNYLFYTGWNAVCIIMFFRYLSRPAALVESGKGSEAFIRHYRITKREAEIIDLVSHGLTNKEIADELCVSLTTIRTHIYNVFRKTDVQSRVELLRLMTGYRE